MSQISKEIFDKIRTRFSNVTLGDEQGMTTLDSDQAVFIEFDYKNKGNVVVNLQDDSVKIYFNDDMISEMDSEQSDNWYAWLRNMRKYAHSNMLNFEVKNINKQRLDRKDFEYLVKNSGQQDGLTMESKMYGSKKKSYQDLNGARMIVKHARTVDEEKRGARSRNISAVYIENDQGERFKFPNTYLPAARAMTRHISNDGYPNDERGKHILDIMAEMMDLRKFSRRTKRQEYTEEAREIIGDATDRYYGLKNTLEGMKKQTGYESYFENWAPDQIEVDENDLEDLKIKLTREVFDDELSDTLTNVGKASKMGKQRRTEDEERMGNEAQGLKQFAAGPDPIVLHPNPESDAEIQTYVQFIKNSNMPKEKRNIALVQRVVAELTNRMADDSLANAINRLDMDNRSDMATAFAIAKKYLTGKTEMVKPKAKKDRYGKDKVESWEQFESAVESTVEESVVQEGTWALPETEADAMEIAAMMANPIALGDGGDSAADKMYGLLGDDELFDDLSVAGDKDPEGDARGIIIGWMMDHVDDYDEKYSETMKMALDKIRADGNDSDITIPRTFGAQQDRGMTKKQADAAYNTSATQGERMGSNADDMKEADSELSVMANSRDRVESTYAAIIKGDAEQGEVGDYIGRGMTKDQIIKLIDMLEPQGYDKDFLLKDLAPMMEAGYDLSTLAGKYGNEPVKGKEGILQTDVEDDVNDIAATMEEDPDLENFAMAFEKSVYASGDTSPEGIRAALEEVLPDYIAGSRIEDLMKVIESTNEGRMSDINIEIQDMVADGASNDEIKKAIPMASDSVIADIRGEMDEGNTNEGIDPKSALDAIMKKDPGDEGIGYVFDKFASRMSDEDADELAKQLAEFYPEWYELHYQDEASDMIAKMKAMAGVGSTAKSNHGIREGEAGYQITPRSIVARQMRKLQDIQNS